MNDRDTIAAIISDTIFADKDGVLQDINHCADLILKAISPGELPADPEQIAHDESVERAAVRASRSASGAA